VPPAALREGGSDLLELIVAQDLGPLWHALQSDHERDVLRGDCTERLRDARMASAIGYLAQRAALDRLDQAFHAAAIPYVVLKGAHVRECVYPDPALRRAGDVDLLVAPDDRRRAACALAYAGYTLHANAANISHEATFSEGLVDIDLHWHMLRPGRTRVDLTGELLERRQRVNGLWGLSDTDTVFLMLTHPAFAKYVCSPNMGLARVADFLLWIDKQPVDWPAVVRLLERAGLKTAAWTVLSWFRMLAPPQAHARLDGWLADVRPGPLRAAYLRQWLLHDLPTRWLDRPFLIQAGFTLALHDRAGDVVHALRGLRRAKHARPRDFALLLGGG
jgi:hypothetical protein